MKSRKQPLSTEDERTLKAMYGEHWICPIEIGGHMDSPLVHILPKLVKRGLVNRKVKNIGPSGRCSYLYSLSPEGQAIVRGFAKDEHQKAKRKEKERMRDDVRTAYRTIEHYYEVYGFVSQIPEFHEDMRFFLNKIIKELKED